MPVAAGSENPLNHLETVETLPKGDLYLRFDIVFPLKLSSQHKQTIVQALRENDEE